MYEYMTLGTDTLVVHSPIEIENGIETIRVLIERPTDRGFQTLMVRLPDYKILMREDYNDEEVNYLMSIVRANASSMFEYAKLGGIKNA